MKAVRIHKFGSKDALKLETVPIPEVGESEVLVRVNAAGINPVDTYIREGSFAVLPTLPAILGKEAAGVVEKVGDGIQGLKVSCRCWYQCRDIAFEHKLNIFNQFYELGDNVKQNTYLMGNLNVCNVRRRRHGSYKEPEDSPRQASIFYTVPDEKVDIFSR